MTTSMTGAPRTAHVRDDRSTSSLDLLLSTVSAELGSLPLSEAYEPIDAVECLARFARRQHGMDLAAAKATLRAALDELGDPHQKVAPASIVRRIELHYRHAPARASAGGAR